MLFWNNKKFRFDSKFHVYNIGHKFAFVKQNLLRKEDGIPLPAKAGSFLPYFL